MILVCVCAQQIKHSTVAQDGSQCAGSCGDGSVLPGDPGYRRLGIAAIQESREEMPG